MSIKSEPTVQQEHDKTTEQRQQLIFTLLYIKHQKKIVSEPQKKDNNF